MNASKMLIALLLPAMISTTAFAVTDNQVFAYAQANFTTLFTGTATAGQYQQYNYRYYPASGNYLAVDASGVISILGPITGNVVMAVGRVTDFADAITAWEATSTPYTMTVRDVSGNCTLYTGSFAGVLTPTGQANIYTTVFANGAAITLTVPGSTAFDWSYPEGGGTATDHTQLTFDSQSRSITGSVDWTHSNGCRGTSTISGSW